MMQKFKNFYDCNKLLLVLIITFLFIANVLKGEDYLSYIIKFKSNSDFFIIPTVYEYKLSPVFGEALKERYQNFQFRNDMSSKLWADLLLFYKVEFKDNIEKEEFLQDFVDNPLIEFIEPNYKFKVNQVEYQEPNDSLFKEQWALKTVGALNAWNIATGKDVIVGVVDTGLDFYHPDLVNQLWINTGEDLNRNGKFDPWSANEEKNGVYGDLNGIDDDGNGVVDDVIGYDFVDQVIANLGDYSGRDPLPMDEHSHGTLVTGVISAQHNNKIGISGLAFNSRIMVLRAFDVTGQGESDDIASAIVYGALNGARVLNFSFGSDNKSKLMESAIKFAYSLGVVMVASSGNDGWDQPHFPSDFSEVISVGASDVNNGRIFRSNFGSQLDLLAPGSNIITTSLNNSYKLASGTSLSAPFVSATAAMLLEKNRNLSNMEIAGIIRSTAVKYDGKWDVFSGSGVLNSYYALIAEGATIIEFFSPKNYMLINKNQTQFVPIILTVLTPFFDSFRLYIGRGVNPNSWDALSDEIYKQCNKDTIKILDVKSLEDTVYTLRLVIQQKNNITQEKRIYVEVFSEARSLAINYFKVLNVIKNGKQAIVVAFKTNQFCNGYVRFRPKGSSEAYREVHSNDNYTNYHTVVIEDDAKYGTQMEAELVVYREDGATVRRPFYFRRENIAFPIRSFNPKSYYFPMSYLFNKVYSFYEDGKPAVVVNDLLGGVWGKTRIYEFENGNFVKRDSINSTWIPVGIGDTNGDGIIEIFTKSSGRTKLFQSNVKGGNPFGKVLFSDTTSLNFWAGELFDLNNDGREELIAHSDTAYHIFSFNPTSTSSDYSKRYEQKGRLKPINTSKKIGTYPGLAVGNFDLDLNYEMCFGNENGNIFIYKIKSNDNENYYFEQSYLDTNTIASSTNFIVRADIDGDGTAEIVYGNYGTQELFGENKGNASIWTFKILKYDVDLANFYEIWKQSFWGVRSGFVTPAISYRNGVAVGELDGKKGDEIIISVFPNLYIFRWDESSKGMKPLWHYNFSFSNSAIVYDFDGNGINEIGFCDGENVVFYEYDANYNKPETPTELNGWATSETSAFLYWNSSPTAEYYIVYKFLYFKDTQIVLEKVAETNLNYCNVENLDKEKYYYFFVTSYNSNFEKQESELSDPLEIYTHRLIEPLLVKEGYENALLVSYTGKLTTLQIEPNNFEIYENNNLLMRALNVVRVNDTLLLVSFSDKIQRGKELELLCKSFRDYYRSPTVEKRLMFILDSLSPLPSEMYLVSLRVIDNSKLVLEFSDEPVIEDMRDKNNYILKPRGEIEDLIVSLENPKQVQIILKKNSGIGALGVTYTITAVNMMSKTGHPITKGVGNTLAFVFTSDDVNSAFIYPNPIKSKVVDRAYIGNLPARAEVYIYSYDLTLLRTLYENDGNGGVEWDCRDENGNEVNAGIYFFRVKGFDLGGEEMLSELKKFVIIR